MKLVYILIEGQNFLNCMLYNNFYELKIKIRLKSWN